jgi:hypothetical protein
VAYFRKENLNYTKPTIKKFNKSLLLLLLSVTIINLNDFNETNKELSLVKDNKIDLLKVKEDNLLVYSLIILRFSLGISK